MINDAELLALINARLQDTAPGIFEAVKKFRDNPSAQTFKDAENIPDALVGQALDKIIGDVLKDVAAQNVPKSANSSTQKKTATDGEKSGSNSNMAP